MHAIPDGTVRKSREEPEEVSGASNCPVPLPHQYTRLNLPSRIQEDSQELSYSVNESQQAEVPSPAIMEKISASEGDSKEQSPSHRATQSSERRSRQLQQLQDEYLSQESLIASLAVHGKDASNKAEASLHREDTSSSRMYISDGLSHHQAGPGKHRDAQADAGEPPRERSARTFIQDDAAYSNMLMADDSGGAAGTQKRGGRAAGEGHFA